MWEIRVADLQDVSVSPDDVTLGKGLMKCSMLIVETTKQRGGTKGNALVQLFRNEYKIVNNINVGSPVGRSDHACITSCDIGGEERVSDKTVYIFEKNRFWVDEEEVEYKLEKVLGKGNIEEKWISS